MAHRYSVAILQGRLSPDPKGHYQFFPKDWRREFPIAKELGFSGIEWLIDSRGWHSNPLFDELFLIEMQRQALPVSSVCADWFMTEAPSTRHHPALVAVVNAASFTTQRLVLVPLLEGQSIRGNTTAKRLAQEVFAPLAGWLYEHDVRIGFETDLPPGELIEFLDGLKSERFGVYYDTGNSTSYGHDCPADIRRLGKRVFGVHIKDRERGIEKPKRLGQGDADFVGILRALHDIGYRGNLVLQAWRGRYFKRDAAQQLAFLNTKQQEAFG